MKKWILDHRLLGKPPEVRSYGLISEVHRYILTAQLHRSNCNVEYFCLSLLLSSTLAMWYTCYMRSSFGSRIVYVCGCKLGNHHNGIDGTVQLWWRVNRANELCTRFARNAAFRVHNQVQCSDLTRLYYYTVENFYSFLRSRSMWFAHFSLGAHSICYRQFFSNTFCTMLLSVCRSTANSGLWATRWCCIYSVSWFIAIALLPIDKQLAPGDSLKSNFSQVVYSNHWVPISN